MWAKLNTIYGMLAALILVFNSMSRISAMPPDGELAGDKLLITGSEFYQRSQSDAGEIRIFLKSIAREPISIVEVKLDKVSAGNTENSHESGSGTTYLYSKLSPPVLMPGQNGELLIKLLKTPSANDTLRCTIRDSQEHILKTSILTQQASLWIPYIGFSEDLSKVYVYVQNNTQIPLSIQLLEVAGINASNRCVSVNNIVSAGDKGCLISKMPVTPNIGEYVSVRVSAKSGDQEFQTSRVVKAVNKFPLFLDEGSLDPKFGLDSENVFVQTMICPAHAHGTHEEAARKFLNDYYHRFSQNPYLLIQMWICRSDKPRAWYKFGPLPDAAVMNPILLTSRSGGNDMNQFHPFFCLADDAKRATAPNRYFAGIRVEPAEPQAFFHASHTPDEIRFLIYCAIATGAKGIMYRGVASSAQSIQDTVMWLNRELRQLKPLLMIAEPVNWATVTNENYSAKSLLCGDEAIIVVIFDRRYFSKWQNNRLFTLVFSKSLKPVEIQAKIPEGFLVSQVESMYSPLSKQSWKCQERQLNFTANMIDSVHVYKLILRRDDSK